MSNFTSNPETYDRTSFLRSIACDYRTDRVRLLNAPPGIVTHIEAAICSGWVKGIQDQRDYGGSHEFKIKGNPWCALKSMLMRTVDLK